MLAKDLPEAVLDMMMSKNITRALTARGLSFPHVLAKSFFAGLQLALAFTFLIIGFNAFSDPKDPAAGMLNSALTLILAVVGLQLGRAVDLEEMHEQVCVCVRAHARDDPWAPARSTHIYVALLRWSAWKRRSL